MSSVHAGFSLKPPLETSLRKYGDRPAVRFDGDTWTYRDLDRRANALANGLADLGAGPGTRIAVLMENRTEFITARIAIIKLGAVVVPVNHDLTAGEIEYVLDASESEAVVCGAGFVDTVDDIAPGLDDLSVCVCLSGEGASESGRFRSFETLVAEHDGSSGPSHRPGPDAVASHSFTGGTTGKPKGVIHTQRSRVMNMYAECIELDITGDDTMLITTPLAHAARLFVVAGLLAGATILLRSSFDREAFLEDVQAHDVTWTFCVPTMIYRLLDVPALSEYDVGSLRTLVYGAAPMAQDRLEEALARFGPVFVQIYGQTEVPNLITTLGKREHRQALEGGNTEVLRSAGQPCLMSDVRVVDLETNETVPAGEPGELLATAPYAMTEYYGRPEKTAETLEGEWVHTGDIGKRTPDGYVHLLDRKDDVIVTGGMNVFSTEVEDAITKHPDVRNCAVVGVPDDDWGEAVKAVVVRHEDGAMDERGLLAFLDGSLASYKQPKVVEFVDDLPKTPYGKIDKTALQ